MSIGIASGGRSAALRALLFPLWLALCSLLAAPAAQAALSLESETKKKKIRKKLT